MENDTIDLKELDKASVLAVLYNASRPQGMGFMQYDPTPMTKEEAKEILDSGSTYFDYLKGRVMKINLSGSKLDPRLYDRDNGQGAAATAIASLKSTKQTNPVQVRDAHNSRIKEAAVDAIVAMNEETRDEGNGVIHLGLADVADKLAPKVYEAIHVVDNPKKSRTWKYAATAAIVAAIGAGIIYFESGRSNKQSPQADSQNTVQTIPQTPAIENNSAYAKVQFLESARKFGLTGAYSLVSGHDLNEITPEAYSDGGPIHQLAKSAGVDLFDESKEPERFVKNGINDYMTEAQAEKLYKGIAKSSLEKTIR